MPTAVPISFGAKMRYLIIASVIACQIVSSSAASASKKAPSFLAPSCFLKNNGKVIDQNALPRKDVDAVVHCNSNLTVFVSAGRISYQYATPVFEHNMKFRMDRMETQLSGANTNCKPEFLMPTSFVLHDFRCGSKPTADTGFQKIIYRNIYPGIDWIIYFKAGQPEYDFVVHPGSDAGLIRMDYGGADQVRQDAFSIVACGKAGTISERGLLAYDELTKLPIACQYRSCMPSGIGFDVQPSVGTIVIDPVLSWSTYYGGTNAEAHAIVPTVDGGACIAGFTTSATDIATSGAWQTIYMGDNDVFLARTDSNGILLWATYYGGTGADQAYGLATDTFGNFYVGGITSSLTGIATAGAARTSYAGGIGDAFLARFTPSGNLEWGTYFGASGTDVGTSICTDTKGNVWIVGYTDSPDSIATAGAYKTTGWGINSDGFIAKFTNAGVLQWSSYYGGNDDDQITGMTTDTAGNIFITGKTASTDSIATSGAYQKTVQTYDDEGFLASFTGAGVLRWGTYFGANGSNDVCGVTADSRGDILVTGSTSCTDSIACSGTWQPIYTGTADAYIIKFTNDGGYQWGTYLGIAGDGGNAVSTDDSGNIYLTGATTSDSGFATAGATLTTYAGGGDAYLAIFSPAGLLRWCTYFGGPNYDEGFAVACNNRSVWITGITQSASGIATPGALDTTFTASAFSDDLFLARYTISDIVNGLQAVAMRCPTSIFPNPAANFLNVSLGLTFGGKNSYSVLDMNGQVVLSGVAIANNGSFSVNIGSLLPGTYLLSWQNGITTGNSPFVVVR